MYERSGHCAKVSMEYEYHPSYYTISESLGHDSYDCPRNSDPKREPPSQPKNGPPAPKPAKPSNDGKESSKE